MALPSFFKINKHKEFNFIPRYYDEKKKNLEERIRSIEREMGVKEGEAYRPTIRKGQMSSYFRGGKRKAHKQSNIRLIIILLVLFFISYLLFFY
ncbi:MAG: hypothetical protein IMY71_11745 [Bacteroidetes bacterium]|nr:hypothetical protein [Bacteroidota bacterium]